MRPDRWRATLAWAPTLILLAAGTLLAQEGTPEWEGKTVSGFRPGPGWVRQNFVRTVGLTPIKKGQPLTRDRMDRAYKELWKTEMFEDVKIATEPDPDKAAQVIVVVSVKEHLLVDSVEFKGFDAIPESQIKPSLRIAAGSTLDPYHLKMDRDYIRGQYIEKGYAFSSVREEIAPQAGGTVLTWHAIEGPCVTVEEILLTGNEHIDASDLRDTMQTKEAGSFLLIPLSGDPFVERKLQEDIERLKLHYRSEGWLDIPDGQQIFLQDLVFNEDRDEVTITIHVDEGPRYHIRSVGVRFDPSSERLFTEEEMRSWLVSKVGNYYTENNADKDVAVIREKYGERAYILAEVSSSIVVAKDAYELDLVYDIKENRKISVARLAFEGNYKTREDVLRREFTRTGFVPGEDFNSKSLTRAMNRIREAGFVEPGEGISVHTQEGEEPDTRDVTVEIEEGQTGNIRFAAGFSSAFGLLGIVEFTQRNFDLGNPPDSFEDMFNGTGFAGGGQTLRLRMSPAARRQSYSMDFREPYLFGYDLGGNVRAFHTSTTRESYDDDRIGGGVSLDKRFDPWTIQLGFEGYRTDISDVDDDAPALVRAAEGRYTVLSLVPALIYDTVDRDAYLVAYDGIHGSLSYEYAGQILPGDGDFNHTRYALEQYLKIYETSRHLKHVLNPQIIVEHIREARRLDDVPLFERLYAGGQGSIRGFEYRGMGPHDGSDPVGGRAYVFASAEYTAPLFVEILRGALFYDVAALTPHFRDLGDEKWRNSYGFGIRFLIPQLGNIPVSLDFGFPGSKRDEDERQTVSFEFGRIF